MKMLGWKGKTKKGQNSAGSEPMTFRLAGSIRCSTATALSKIYKALLYRKLIAITIDFKNFIKQFSMGE